jgi:hypothetical protein
VSNSALTGAHCGKHPEVAAVELCTRCGTFLCGDCVEYVRDETAACSDCAPLLRGVKASARAKVAPLLAAWHEAQPKLAYARQRFNEAAEAHDSAIALFPTTLLARAFGMAPVGRV